MTSILLIQTKFVGLLPSNIAFVSTIVAIITGNLISNMLPFVKEWGGKANLAAHRLENGDAPFSTRPGDHVYDIADRDKRAAVTDKTDKGKERLRAVRTTVNSGLIAVSELVLKSELNPGSLDYAKAAIQVAAMMVDLRTTFSEITPHHDFISMGANMTFGESTRVASTRNTEVLKHINQFVSDVKAIIERNDLAYRQGSPFYEPAVADRYYDNLLNFIFKVIPRKVNADLTANALKPNS